MRVEMFEDRSPRHGAMQYGKWPQMGVPAEFILKGQ